MRITKRDFLLSVPALGLVAAGFPRRVIAANAVYRPVTLPAKPGASISMTDAQRDVLEHQIHCQCGCNLDVYTCRTTDFACSVSPAMHADVMGLVSGGYGAKDILAAFKSVYG